MSSIKKPASIPVRFTPTLKLLNISRGFFVGSKKEIEGLRNASDGASERMARPSCCRHATVEGAQLMLL